MLGVPKGVSSPIPIATTGSVACTPCGAAERLPWGTGTLGDFFRGATHVFSIVPLKDMHSPSGDGPQLHGD